MSGPTSGGSWFEMPELTRHFDEHFAEHQLSINEHLATGKDKVTRMKLELKLFELANTPTDNEMQQFEPEEDEGQVVWQTMHDRR